MRAAAAMLLALALAGLTAGCGIKGDPVAPSEAREEAAAEREAEAER